MDSLGEFKILFKTSELKWSSVLSIRTTAFIDSKLRVAKLFWEITQTIFNFYKK